ncbi:ornithine cyclodeaminase [Vibrio parahaemolyticus]|uniref:ornithine cyclodeaminase family protein n=1 Tax=Vibrio parahaemolyticus TaxID=670 RepID=UPI00084B10B9|nr:ornithine cyclodeaminase family protein [Vibrio parahaemolyticus]EJC7015264.1 ornithine cyclodeaminase family protein [Vibrio parahaemolyticus]ODY31298.1 ornithine cyclodeaminase [Vibrio parahaemolyticus]
MKVIDAQQVAQSLSMHSLIETMRDIYAQPATIPQRRVMSLEEGKYEAFALLPAWNQELIAVKAFTYFPENPLQGKDTLASKLLVFKRGDGEPIALVDGKVLTFWRTAAASALAADYLARKNTSRLLICGTGNLAPYFAWAYAAIRPLKQVYVWGRNPEKAAATVDQILSSSEYQSLPEERQFSVSVVENVEQVIDQVDIISCITASVQPLFNGSDVPPGTHIDLVGNHDLDKRECDSVSVQRANVYVDSRINVLAEAGDLLIPIQEGVFTPEDIYGELPELCAQQVQGRQSDEVITLYKSVGSALADLAAVKAVLLKHGVESQI